jgi:hypothetical protein
MSSTTTSDEAPARPSRWSGIMLAARWLRSYQPAWFRAMLQNLHGEVARRGIAFRIVEARSRVRAMLRVEGVEESVGRIDRHVAGRRHRGL